MARPCGCPTCVQYWGNERTTFVIGPDGKVASVLRKVKPAEHDDRALAELAA